MRFCSDRCEEILATYRPGLTYRSGTFGRLQQQKEEGERGEKKAPYSNRYRLLCPVLAGIYRCGRSQLFAHETENQSFLVRRHLCKRLRAVPWLGTEPLLMLAANVRIQVVRCSSTATKVKLYDNRRKTLRGGNKNKPYSAPHPVLGVCFAALRLENCSSESSGTCDNVESSSSVTRQSADLHCYNSVSSLKKRIRPVWSVASEGRTWHTKSGTCDSNRNRGLVTPIFQSCDNCFMEFCKSGLFSSGRGAWGG